MKSSVRTLVVCGIAASAAAETMSIVSKADPKFCLDLLGERTMKDTPIDVWECTAGLLGQQWYFDAGSYKIRSAIDGTKCIDGGNMTAGTALTLEDCSNASKSQFFGWDVATNAIFSTPEKGDMATTSMCLQATALLLGKATMLAPCTQAKATKNMQWQAVVGPPPSPKSNETFTFSPGANQTLCMGLQSAPNLTANGAPVKVSRCSGLKDQEWVFSQGSYRIQSALNPLKCIDAWSMKQGNQLMLWDCNGFPQQQWGYKQTEGKSTGNVYLTQARDNQECLDVQAPFAVLGKCSEWQLKKVTPHNITLI